MKINKKNFFLIQIVIFLFFINKSTHAEISLYEIKGNKIIYENNNELIIADGEAYAKDQFGKEIFAKKIIYDKKNSIINTETNSIFLDNKGNKLSSDKFFYDLNSKIITIKKNATYVDKEGNIFNFTSLNYNENQEKGIGNNLKATLIDKSSIEGLKAEFDNKSGIISVHSDVDEGLLGKFINIFNKNSNSYTSCENKNKSSQTIKERCPDWSLETQKTVHDKNNKMIYHYGSVIKIRQVPIFYTPYFSHPDPTVKRKSGFLPPSIKNFTDLGQSAKIPYYWVIDQNKDLMFTPIYYFEDNPLFLATYRQQNSKSKFYLDTSYTSGYKNLNKTDVNGNLITRTDGSRNHFFFNFLGNYDDLLFQKNDLEINIQRISQKNYLNVHQINTEYVKQNLNALNNNIILNSYEGNKKISIRSNIFENLNDENTNTKYQYNLPNIDFSNFFSKFNQNVSISSSFANNNIGGDSNQTYLNNTVETVSDQKTFSFLDAVGFVFKSTVKNMNYNNQNIANQKENFNLDNYLTLAMENTYPLIKIDEQNEQSIIPKIFTKFTSGSMKNISGENKILSYEDIYSMNRSNNATAPETGASIGYGVEYNSIDKAINNNVYQKTSFAIGQVISAEKKNEMPSNSTLSDNRSAFAGYLKYNRNNEIESGNISSKSSDALKFDINYNYIISKNLNKLLLNSIDTNFTLANNTIAAQYYETREISNEHYLDLKYIKKFNNDFNFLTGLRKNLKNKFTESNFIEANYDSDCLKISLNLSKQFYYNEELKPSNNLNLTLILKPFGSPISPDLSSFLN